MAGIIWVTEEDSWRLAGRLYVPLLHRVSAASDNQADRKLLFQAELFQLLDFSTMEPPQRTRLGRTLTRVVEEIHRDLLWSKDDVERAAGALLAMVTVSLHRHFR